MLRIDYTFAQMKKASTKLALARSELEAAEILIKEGHHREAVFHMYSTSFYTSQSFLADKISSNPTHQKVKTVLNKEYGRSKDFPQLYVKLHNFLKDFRNEYSYKTTATPDTKIVEKKLKVLTAFLKFAFKHIPLISILDIIKGIYKEHEGEIKEFSYDVYSPRTYSHHTRITFWHPYFYLNIYNYLKIITYSRELLKKLKVKNPTNYVIGLNSRLNQYKSIHLILLDIDSLDKSVESALKSIGGVLLKTERGFHFIGNKIIVGQEKWEKEMKKLSRKKELKSVLDKDHISISLKRGYATLRISESPVKPRIPIFYKDLR